MQETLWGPAEQTWINDGYLQISKKQVLTCVGDKSPWLPSVVLKGLSVFYFCSNCILCLGELISIKMLCCESVKLHKGHYPVITSCLLALFQLCLGTTNKLSKLLRKQKECFK